MTIEMLDKLNKNTTYIKENSDQYFQNFIRIESVEELGRILHKECVNEDLTKNENYLSN